MASGSHGDAIRTTFTPLPITFASGARPSILILIAPSR
jgi:hypothetical protein